MCAMSIHVYIDRHSRAPRRPNPSRVPCVIAGVCSDPTCVACRAGAGLELVMIFFLLSDRLAQLCTLMELEKRKKWSMICSCWQRNSFWQYMSELRIFYIFNILKGI